MRIPRVRVYLYFIDAHENLLDSLPSRRSLLPSALTVRTTPANKLKISLYLYSRLALVTRLERVKVKLYVGY